MTRLLLAALLLIPFGAASAQSFVGVWTLDEPQRLSDGVTMLHMWLEVGADGRLVAFADIKQRGDVERKMGEHLSLTDNGCIRSENDRPACPVFLDNGNVQITDDGVTVTFRPVVAPVRVLDLMGDWRIVDGPAEFVTFTATDSEGMAVSFYLHDRPAGLGTWDVDEQGLTLDVTGPGAGRYTDVRRDGGRLMLSGEAGTLVLEPLAP